jgi:hypothetical protein
MMILFVELTKGIGHKLYQLMKSSPINTINSHSIRIILSMHIIHLVHTHIEIINFHWLLARHYISTV